MPTKTYTPLANITLSVSASTITFSSIPATYNDLVLVVTASNPVAANLGIRANADSGNNYFRQRLTGDGTSVVSADITTGNIWSITTVAQVNTTAGFNAIYHIMDYSSTNKTKMILARLNSAGLGTEIACGRWNNTAAVTSIVISGTLLDAGSTFALYGIVAI
jgi:hypothetical protein